MTTKTMKEHRKRSRARQLLALVDRSVLHRHLAYWLAGWADWLNLLPEASSLSNGPTRIRHVVIAGGMLVLLLCLIVGPVLRALHPLLVALGRVDTPVLLAGIVVLLNALQWALGWRVLRRLRVALDDKMDGLRAL